MGKTPLMSSQSEDNLTVNMKITGKVQGVGFRYFVLRQAQELGINGWVSNKSNGDVEALAQGEKADLEQFIAKVKEGPTFSRVDNVNLEWMNKGEQYFGFEII